MNNLHHQFARTDGGQHVLANGFFLHQVRKLLGNDIVHVGIQKGTTYIFESFGYIDLGNSPLTFEEFKRTVEPFAQIFKHRK